MDNRSVNARKRRSPEHVDATDVNVDPVFGLVTEDESGEARELGFAFSDVERAKLDPVLDFKGKKRRVAKFFYWSTPWRVKKMWRARLCSARSKTRLPRQ